MIFSTNTKEKQHRYNQKTRLYEIYKRELNPKGKRSLTYSDSNCFDKLDVSLFFAYNNGDELSRGDDETDEEWEYRLKRAENETIRIRKFFNESVKEKVVKAFEEMEKLKEIDFEIEYIDYVNNNYEDIYPILDDLMQTLNAFSHSYTIADKIDDYFITYDRYIHDRSDYSTFKVQFDAFWELWRSIGYLYEGVDEMYYRSLNSNTKTKDECLDTIKHFIKNSYKVFYVY